MSMSGGNSFGESDPRTGSDVPGSTGGSPPHPAVAPHEMPVIHPAHPQPGESYRGEQAAVNHYVTVLPTKSVGLAVLLSFLFGPLGMLYTTVAGAAVMFCVNLVVGLFTYGLGLFLTWPICVIWAASAANAHNTQLTASVARMSRY